MGDENLLQLILQVKDLASEGIKRLQSNLEQLPQTTDRMTRAFETLKLSTTDSMETQRAMVIGAYNAIKNSATSTADEIQRAEAAKAKALEQIDSQNFATRKGLLNSLKDHWVAVAATVASVWAAVNTGKELLQLGAAAKQAEESFSQVAKSYQVDGDALIAKLREVSVGAIDESALMQKSVKLLQQGLNPDQIVNLMEVARTSARIAGVDIATAFDQISTATANQMTRGLKSMGIVIDQNKAFEDYANRLGIAKEALDEQQQSQAIANAVITEGIRQRSKMGPILVNESEQLQINKARYEELKETIGKDLLSILGLASKNFDAIGVALGAAALMSAPAVFRAIADALKSASDASTSFSAGTKAGIIAIVAGLGYMAGKWIETALDIWGTQKAIKATEIAQMELTKNTTELTERLRLLGFTGADAWQKYEAAVKAGILIIDQVTGKQVNLAEQMKQIATIWAAQGKTLSDTVTMYVELIKKDFETGKITMAEYVDFVDKQNKKITDDQIAQSLLKIEQIRKEVEMKKILEADGAAQIKVVQEEINQIRIKAFQDHQKLLEEAGKIRDDNTEKAKQAAKEEFDVWKSLQELKLQTVKNQYDLEDALDAVALKKKEMTELEAFERRFARDREYQEKEIALAEATAQKILDQAMALTGQNEILTAEEVKIYQEALAKKEEAQMKLQATVVTSEQTIKEFREKCYTEAKAAYASATQDEEKLTEAQAADKIAALEKFHKFALLSNGQYMDAVLAIERRTVDEFKAGLQEMSAALNSLVAIIDDRKRKMESLISSFTGPVFDDIKRYFGGMKEALVQTTESMAAEIRKFFGAINSGSYETFWNAAMFGRKMTEMIGVSIYDWAARVSDYIQYVKGLMQSLKETIMSYQDQLDELRGNDKAILERWYEQEKQALNEKYKDQLGQSKEYYAALALLDQLYAEKKKKLAEESKSGSGTDFGSSGAGSGGERFDVTGSLAGSLSEAMQTTRPATGGAGAAPPVQNLGSLSMDGIFKVETYDPESTYRFIQDVFFPEFERYLALRGIKLGTG